MFSFENLTQANDELNQMKFKEFSRFDYDGLVDYFNQSRFFLFDNDNQDLESVQKQFEKITNPHQVLFFYFIFDEQKMISYLALFSNTVGIIYDLMLGPSILSDIFDIFFCDFCLVPLHKQDKKDLSYLIDLSNNYFLNSSYISIVYNNESLKNYVEENILNRIDQNCKNRRHYNDLNFQTMIRLIVYYVPLIGIITDDLYFSPSNGMFTTLPKLSRDEFDEIIFIGGNSFQNSSLCLHRKSFQFYTIDKMKDEVRNKFYVQKKFFTKMYDNCENSCIIPCYGIFESQSYRGYESQNGFLFKFICNGKITDKKSRKKDINIKYWDNTTKSLNFYRLLASITFLHEFGYYHRNVKPDHVFLDNENRAYFGGMATICKLSNKNNESIGSDIYSSPEQYKRNISSVKSDIFSFGVCLHFIITGGLGYRSNKFIVNDEKIDALLQQCTNEYQENRPDSLILFTQMHESNCFLPKTNRALIDEFFRNTYSTYLTTNFVKGKYLSKWSMALQNSKFRNLILKNLPSTFIYKFSFTEMEANLNQALNSNLFLIDYDNMDIFQIDFFAEELNNQQLKEKTDEMIELISKPSQILNKLIFYANLLNDGDVEENSILHQYFDKYVNEFADNFDDCILLSSSFLIDPNFILDSIIKEKELDDAHNTVLYILQIGNNVTSIDVVINILTHFKKLSDSDILSLDAMFETNEFSTRFIHQSNDNNFTCKLIEYDKLLEDSRKKLENIINEMDAEKKDELVEHNDLIEIINKIEDEQNNIKLLKSTTSYIPSST